MARKLLAAATLFLAECNWYYNSVPSPDALLEAIPWFDHMIKSKAVSPYPVWGNRYPRQQCRVARDAARHP